MSKDLIVWPSDYLGLEAHHVDNPQVKGFVEGYAMALSHMMLRLSGDSPVDKSYDPMVVESGEMHSYAFDMKDGGRHHPISDYKDIGEITKVLLEEAIDWIKE